MLLASGVSWQIESAGLYDQYAVSSGRKPFTADFIESDLYFLRAAIVPANILFYSCLWTVKLSFLIFFRRLFTHFRGHRIWWWCVLIFTILTWVACIADIHYECSLGSSETIYGGLQSIIIC